MRNATEKLQHRRHRAVYLAPTAVHYQHFSSQSYDSGEHYFGSEAYDHHKFIIDDLRIPLFVEIPQDDNLRFPVTSPPCSNGSDVSPLLFPAISPVQHHRTLQWPFAEQHRQKELSPSQQQQERRRRRRPFREKLYKVIASVFVVIDDFQVVKQRAHHGRRGRIIVQQSLTAAEEIRRQRQYQSTDLLRPLQQRGSPPVSFLMQDDMV
jgi:hypothetical protein